MMPRDALSDPDKARVISYLADMDSADTVEMLKLAFELWQRKRYSPQKPDRPKLRIVARRPEACRP